MRHLSTRDENGNPNLGVFKNNGLLYGLPLGILVGVLIAGPHFHEWSLMTNLGMILGCGIGAGIVGYFAVAIAYGSEAGGYGTTGFSNEGSEGGTSDSAGGNAVEGGE